MVKENKIWDNKNRGPSEEKEDLGVALRNRFTKTTGFYVGGLARWAANWPGPDKSSQASLGTE